MEGTRLNGSTALTVATIIGILALMTIIFLAATVGSLTPPYGYVP